MAPTYTKREIADFLALLDVPHQYRDLDNITPNEELLRILHIHMISTIPYETLTLHYSTTRRIHLDPRCLFQKIVADGRGRGGYCLENNLFFFYMLRELGFKTYLTGVKSKVRHNGIPQGNFQGWGHIVQIVTFSDGSRWVVDVCFGGDGMTQPMQLVEGSTVRNMGTQDARFIRDFIPGQCSRAVEHKMWQYQYRNSNTDPWRTFYTFSDTIEWLPRDFEVVNCWTGTSPDSSAVTSMCVVKFLRRTSTSSEDTERVATQQQEIFGKRMLVNHVVKENLGGKTEVVEECHTEEERILALKKWFGLDLTPEEKSAIQGHLTELRAPN